MLHWPSKPDVWGAHFSGVSLKTSGAWCTVQTLHSWGRCSRFLSSFPVVGLPRVVGYGKTESQPLLPTSDVALFMLSSWEGTSPQAVRSFSEATVSVYVSADFMCPRRCWGQGLPMLPSWAVFWIASRDCRLIKAETTRLHNLFWRNYDRCWQELNWLCNTSLSI